MREIHLDKIQSVDKALLKTVPKNIVGERIDEPCLVFEAGKPILGYFFLPPALLKDTRKACRSVKITKNHRTSGLPTQSVVLGVMPRHTTMNDYCRFTKDSKTEKEHFAILMSALEYCSGLYKEHFPESYKAALKEVYESVDKSWRYNESPYLTINVNINHAIKYHRDSGNFKGALSTVLIVKENINGGELCCPELGVSLSQRDGALTLFEGQRLLHGVRPIQATQKDAMRASVVFYSMANLKHCYPYADEWKRAQKVATERARHATTADNKLLLAKQAKGALTRKLGVEGYAALVDRIKSKK